MLLKLLEHFTLTDIVVFIILFLAALKELSIFFEWLEKKGVNIFNKKYLKPKELEETVNELTKDVNKLAEKVDVLIQSDKDDIKAFIIRQHHYFCYQLKQIDDQSLDCIQRRYAHYIEEGGNTYVPNLMQDLRNLPRSLPSAMKKYN